MNEKMSISKVSLQAFVSGEERASGTPTAGRALVLLSLLVLVLALVVVTMRAPAIAEVTAGAQPARSAVVEMDFSGVADGYAYYTERYWQSAEARAALAAGSEAAVSEPAYAYYTERYWNRAENSVTAAPVDESEEYAYYTERYWNMAATEQASGAESSEAEDFAYYTERYWNRAHNNTAGASSEEDGYAYYTERYWRQAQEQ
ncbi:MAG TPA: hypothetical protein VK879_11165 [Candidatus Sulfomarinibacteraceae bacterium]|nr:hypothetical protein [Candidatus Sulfomarinibacteraceae bacterium]